MINPTLEHHQHFSSPQFSAKLQKKIDYYKSKMLPVKLGSLQFSSPLLLAPMSGISTPPFRLLMEDIGAGGTVSELISCTGTYYQNKQTLDMLRIDPREKNVGLQLFGDDAEHMSFAAKIAEANGAKFIDINMGCPVRKVVTKGAGSALLKEPKVLAPFFQTIKKSINIPLTIKIRTGWSEPNAEEVLHVAEEEGIEMVAIHGRTREQQYRGRADWDYIEQLNQRTKLPLIGNGDLHTHHLVRKRLIDTRCPALMLGRGPLRNPFIFLESYAGIDDSNLSFDGKDYYEIIERFALYLSQHYNQDDQTNQDRKILVQLKKIIVWFAAGFPHTVKFRASIFSAPDKLTVLNLTQDYFYSLEDQKKFIDDEDSFMNGGHG